MTQGPLEEEYSAILDLVGSNQFLSYRMTMSFFYRLCPAPFPPISTLPKEGYPKRPFLDYSPNAPLPSVLVKQILHTLSSDTSMLLFILTSVTRILSLLPLQPLESQLVSRSVLRKIPFIETSNDPISLCYLLYHSSGTSILLYIIVIAGLPWWLSSKESACQVGDLGSIPGSGRFLGEEVATLFSILAWEITRTEEPGGLQSQGLQRDTTLRLTDNNSNCAFVLALSCSFISMEICIN